MATMLFELTVELEGADPYVIVADQRDVARWEVQPFGWPVGQLNERVSMVFFRFLAWSASARQGRTKEAFDPWSDVCVEVMPVEDEESELPADAEDPGRTVL